MLSQKSDFLFAWKILQVVDALVIVIEFCRIPSDLLVRWVVGRKAELLAYVVYHEDGNSGSGPSCASDRPCEIDGEIFPAVLSFAKADLNKPLKGGSNRPHGEISKADADAYFHRLFLGGEGAELLPRDLLCYGESDAPVKRAVFLLQFAYAP